MLIQISLTKNKQVSENNTDNNIENNVIQETEEEQQNEIKNMSESNRMKRYVGIFFENIENKNYEKAYNVLNYDFKTTYFPTIEKFEEYVKKHFNPSTMGVTYDNIERLGNNKTGNMYVLWLTIFNIFNKQESNETNFVIIENDYNNYEMSFSVIEE